MTTLESSYESIAQGRHGDPFKILGPHSARKNWTVRSWQPQAEAITRHIDCAIGMSKAIGDEAAIVFAASFYRAIGFGRSVGEAFEQGKTALLLEGIPEEQTPQLRTREGVDANQVYLLARH